MIEWVLFDAVGTVMEPRPPAVAVYYEYGLSFGSKLEPTQIESRFATAFQKVFGLAQKSAGSSPALATSETIEQEKWRAVVELIFDDLGEQLPNLFDALWRHFAQRSSWSVFRDVAFTFDALQRSGIHFALASNFDGRLRKIVESDSVLGSCERLFISSEIGFAKPSLSFFDRISSMLDCSPDQILMIGDDFENDVRAPNLAGWNACQICRRSKEIDNSPSSSSSFPSNTPGAPQQFVDARFPSEITSLSDILDWIR